MGNQIAKVGHKNKSSLEDAPEKKSRTNWKAGKNVGSVCFLFALLLVVKQRGYSEAAPDETSQ